MTPVVHIPGPVLHTFASGPRVTGRSRVSVTSHAARPSTRLHDLPTARPPDWSTPV